MRRRVNAIKKALAAALAAVLLSGCSAAPAKAPETSETSVSVSEETAAAASEERENRVRTAEELAGKKVIALTFDDGPNTGATQDILDIIEEYGIKASFFVIGQNITPDTAVSMQRAYSLGCEIDSHSFTHSDMTKFTAEQIKDEMSRTAGLIYEYVGEYPHFFRPPYIAYNDTMYENIDLPFICGLGCDDWEDSVSAEKRAEFLKNKCPDGCIVLLHDQPKNTKTVEAVREAVPVLLEKGYEFVTVSELFIAKGVTPASGVIYSFATEKG
jgi:peptidoglycan/xylan/chitin deacetylase (PgdA/CDA1 family)